MSYSILKSHGGRIDVESKAGEGSRFVFLLPASQAHVPSAAEEENALIKGQGRILVMDDEQLVRDFACRALGRMGYRADSAREGKEAVQSYLRAREEGNPYDAVILDLTIPGGLGGKETMRELLRIDPRVRAIVSSGFSNDPLISGFREFGFCGVLLKPYRIGDMSRLFSELLGGKND